MSESQHSSDNTESVELLLETGFVVLIDPLALDGLRDTFDAQFASRLAADERTVLSLPPALRVGVRRVPAFAPGRYCLSRADIEEIEPGNGDDDPAVFDIDTGTLIAVGIGYLPVLAQVLTWERYDWLLQSPVDDHSRWDEIVREVGGTMFCIPRRRHRFTVPRRRTLSPSSAGAESGTGINRLMQEGLASGKGHTSQTQNRCDWRKHGAL